MKLQIPKSQIHFKCIVGDWKQRVVAYIDNSNGYQTMEETSTYGGEMVRFQNEYSQQSQREERIVFYGRDEVVF